MSARALTVWCAVVAIATAAAFTVDCNEDYTDCHELSKLNAEDGEAHRESSKLVKPIIKEMNDDKVTTTTISPTRSTSLPIIEKNKEIDQTTIGADTVEEFKPKPRLLNLNVDDLQNFANALHNQTEQVVHKKLPDLSDVNLDDDDDSVKHTDTEEKHTILPEKFFTNLEAPFHPMLPEARGSDEEMCKENGIPYKVGERLERGCEESCECTAAGTFECFPRCKHPYIRRGRRLNDPLCFESPVDDCCSIIACATGNLDVKPTTIEVCHHENDTYTVGMKWHIGCHKTCECEPHGVVNCKPRCNVLPPSESCINVQDPSDACCEVQVCDVSQDAHEEPENVTSSTTTTTTTTTTEVSKQNIVKEKPMRPLVLAEPIGSVKVLQNNSVQVNLIHMNNTEDPIHLLLSKDGGNTFKNLELNYSNLILNLEGGNDYILKTRETGTKFNFTITATDANEVPTEEAHNDTKIGCYQEGHFYAVGEEFHIGCTELCECTGPDKKECVALVCPSHVGLEIMSKGCVRWAPSPPPVPPNCCPRAAKCLSDGTCHYKGISVPNWTEVPVSVTGCEQRCFCENGELDCQDACTPLPSLPPQTLRCPPMHRPAPVNISDEDCCKQWGCVPIAGITDVTYHKMTTESITPINYVTPIASIPTQATSVLAKPQDVTHPTNFFKHLSPVKTIPKIITPMPSYKDFPNYSMESLYTFHPDHNVTVFTLDDIGSPLKILHPDRTLTSNNIMWEYPKKTMIGPFNSRIPSNANLSNNINKIPNFILSDRDMHRVIEKINPQPIKIYSDSQKNPHYFTPANGQITNYNLGSTVPPPVGRIFFNPSGSNPTTSTNLPPKHVSKEVNHAKTSQVNTYVPESREKYLGSQSVEDKNLNEKLDKLNQFLWSENTNDKFRNTYLTMKAPSNPYQTVLSRVMPSLNDGATSASRHETKSYSALDLEQMLNQMEVESEVNRNLGRSADNNQNANSAGPTTENFPSHPPYPSFLPTVPPEIPEIHFPRDDLGDYDQNNIHRPTMDKLPGLPQGFPPGLPLPTHYGDDNKKLTVLSLQADSPTSVKMLFGLPPVLVGLRGSVDLRYTDQADDDISHWFSQVFAPTDEVLTTPRLEFTLSGLKPSTTYKIRGKLFLHNLPVEPESDIRIVKTMDVPSVHAPVEEKRREVDSRLSVMEVNDTAAHISWRHFSEEELQLIDGIQIRYRPIGTPIYSMTELLHHSRSAAELHDLRPGTRYEASLVLVPPPRAVTELHDPGRVEFTTSPYVDPYNWTVTIDARAVGSEAAELTWRGVPSPAERWVRVYRAAHACGSTSTSRREHDAFRLAARDLPPAVTLTGLEPNTRCRVWLELFLTNGKVKTSNVLEINTKSLDTPEPIDNEIESASVAGSRTSPRGDYYGALVVVGVVAALGALTSLLLLLVVVRRHRPRSVAITAVPSAPRDSSLPPYDNPAYKLELQQETMDL